MVEFARARSPYYHDLYRHLPDKIHDVGQLPVTNKRELMACFDEWATDRRVTLRRAREHVDNPARIGDKFLGSYTAITTSGTSGQRGIFVKDESSQVITLRNWLRMLAANIRPRTFQRFRKEGSVLFGMMTCTGQHSATSIAADRIRSNRLGKRCVADIPVQTPIAETVARLNQIQPPILSLFTGYALQLLTEQLANRLHIWPSLIVVFGEQLLSDDLSSMAETFQTKVVNFYAASECLFMASSCGQGWLHVNDDWVYLEPVDADYRPVPPGQPSETVLITNLANRVQPVLRYD